MTSDTVTLPQSSFDQAGHLTGLHHIFRLFLYENCERMMFALSSIGLYLWSLSENKLHLMTWTSKLGTGRQPARACVLLRLHREGKPRVAGLDNCVTEAWQTLGFGPLVEVTLPNAISNFPWIKHAKNVKRLKISQVCNYSWTRERKQKLEVNWDLISCGWNIIPCLNQIRSK